MTNIEKVARRTALESSEALGITVYAILNEKYEDEWLWWDSATIYMELRDDFTCEPSSETMDRVSAVQLLMTTGEFFTRLEAYLNICNTLTSGSPAFSIFDPVSSAEAAWGLAEVSFMREFLPFSPGIKAYIRTTLNTEGLYPDYPDIFSDVLGKRPADADNIRAEALGSLHDGTKDEIDKFVHDQLESMVYQFNELDMGDKLMSIIKEKDRRALVIS